MILRRVLSSIQQRASPLVMALAARRDAGVVYDNEAFGSLVDNNNNEENNDNNMLPDDDNNNNTEAPDDDQQQQEQQKDNAENRSRHGKAVAAEGGTAASDHPKYPVMIRDAIVQMKQRKGVSGLLISKTIENKHKSQLPPNFRKMLTLQLRNLVRSGRLIRNQSRYRCTPFFKKNPEAQRSKSSILRRLSTSTSRPRKKTTKKRAAASSRSRSSSRARTGTRKKKQITKSKKPKLKRSRSRTKQQKKKTTARSRSRSRSRSKSRSKSRSRSRSSRSKSRSKRPRSSSSSSSRRGATRPSGSIYKRRRSSFCNTMV